MSATYGSTTMGGAVSKGNLVTAQDMIGIPGSLTVREMQNGHIGASQAQVIDIARAPYIAAQNTPAVAKDGTALKWDIPTGTWVVGP